MPASHLMVCTLLTFPLLCILEVVQTCFHQQNICNNDSLRPPLFTLMFGSYQVSFHPFAGIFALHHIIHALMHMIQTKLWKAPFKIPPLPNKQAARMYCWVHFLSQKKHLQSQFWVWNLHCLHSCLLACRLLLPRFCWCNTWCFFTANLSISRITWNQRQAMNCATNKMWSHSQKCHSILLLVDKNCTVLLLIVVFFSYFYLLLALTLWSTVVSRWQR